MQNSKNSLPLKFWLYWITLVLAVSVEFCMVFWSADYMERALGLPRSSAVQTVSLFLAGMILGRLVSSWILRYIAASTVVLASMLLGALAFMLFWRTETAWVAMIGLAFTGFFVSSLYPLILSIAIGSANGNTAQAGARATLASGTAILVLPLVLGWLADKTGLRSAFMVVAVLFAAMLFMTLITRRVASGTSSTESVPSI
jgi:fucose permease